MSAPPQNFKTAQEMQAALAAIPANGNGHQSTQPAGFLAEHLRKIDERKRDPALEVRGNSPNFGRYPVPHVLSFASIFATAAKTYRDSDEATLHSLDNARHMRNDCGIMECLEQRQRLTALLDWHLEPEDETSADQMALCEKLTTIIQRIKRFTEYRRNLLEALWYGKYGIENAYNYNGICGEQYIMPYPHPRNQDDDWGWKPINGDKLEFRYDDGKQFEDPEKYAGQMGIRVGAAFFGIGDKVRDRWAVEATSRGLAYFLAPWERKMCVIHKHMVEDTSWEDAQHAGRIHGVGIRSRIYWDWFQKQEALAMLMEYLERSAGGIELWYYPAGNAEAEKDTRNAAENRVGNQRNIVLIPRPIGDDGMAYGVEVIEPGMAGIEQLKDLLITYFGHRIKRYILGQVLSSEAEATGLGSGVADLHLDTLLSIVKFDATNLEETLTDQLVQPIKDFNFPEARNTHIRFVIETESHDVAAKMEAFEKAYNMGAKLKAAQVMETIGAAIPDSGDEVLQNPQMAQAAMMGQQGQMPGQPQPGQPQPKGIAFDAESLTAELMQKLWGDPQSLAGQKITYVAEGGKWVQRELPGFDTGDRHKAEDGEPERFGKGFDESKINRDADGKFASVKSIMESGITDENAEQLKSLIQQKHDELNANDFKAFADEHNLPTGRNKTDTLKAINSLIDNQSVLYVQTLQRPWDDDPDRHSRTFNETQVNRDNAGQFAEKPDAATFKSDLESHGAWKFAISLSAALDELSTGINQEMQGLYDQLQSATGREERRIEKELDRLEDRLEVELRRLPDIGYNEADNAADVDENLKQRFKRMAQDGSLKEFAKATVAARKDRIQELREERKPLRREMAKLEAADHEDDDEAEGQAQSRYDELESRLEQINEELHVLSDLMRSNHN